MSSAAVIRIKPYFYIHVLDNNSNVTRVEVGPQTFTRQDHEKLVSGPDAMIMIPPRNYCIIQNPVQRDEKGNVVREEGGQIKVRHGDEEVRFEQEPFALFPGEKLFGKVTPLQVVAPNSALKLRAARDLTVDGNQYLAGDEWLFKGPGTYIPRVEVTVVEVVNARVVKPLQALRLKAKKTFKHGEITRKAGEEYLHKEIGAYIPHVDEEVVETVNAFVLTEKKALALRAKQTFVDCFGKHRKAGEEWLVTLQDAESHIPDVSEQVVGEIPVTILSSREYAVILDPVDPKTGKPQLGNRELRKGEASFFLRPGERLEAGIQKVHVLETEEALLLRAREAYKDGQVIHHPGDRWMIHGPTDYIPPVQVEIVEKRKLIPLDENEGIYVRDIKTGRVRAHVGSSYLLTASEELWSKELPAVVEEQLAKEVSGSAKGKVRDHTRVVVYKAPHNSCCQIYDYKEKKARLIWGPDLVMLGPDEQFTVLSLSGDKPKRPHVIKSLALQLGPDFMTDVVIVETADHARLSLKLSYNWYFEVDTQTKDAEKIFAVPDFVGDACKAIAARVRGAVAGHSFDEFHKHSAKLIRTAIFGIDPSGKIKNRFAFSQNKLVITNIDIQSVEPVDSRTRDALQKSVQLAIEITTKSQEAEARHEAERREQEARGRLERQKIEDEAEAEKARTHLLGLQAESASVESAGQAVAEAKARADATQIESEAKVEQSRLSSKAEKIKADAELTTLKARQESEIGHQKALNELEISRARDLANIESSKFKRIVTAIGANTLKEIAQAGPNLQLQLLKGLGLKSFIITDGSSPINLFNSAGGLIPPQISDQ
jgi:major vault protein